MARATCRNDAPSLRAARGALGYSPAVRRLALAIGLVVAFPSPGLAFVRPVTKRADLDGDAEREVVRVRPVEAPDPQDPLRRTQVRVSDTCPDGPVDRRIAGIQDNLELLRLRRADARAGREVFLILRSGARGVLGEARVVAWRRSSGRPCRVPRALFRYSSDRHTRTPRGGNGDIESFTARVRDVTRRYRGLEVALDERFQTRSDPPTFGSIKKVTYWRYSTARDRYVHYETKIRRLRVPR